MEGTGPSQATGKIDHVFVVLLENEPFDRTFADYPGADGDRNQPQVTDDNNVPWWAKILPFEPTHGVASWRFRRLWAYAFFKGKHGPQDRQLYWQWAKDYVLADRHRTQQGPSTPNHVQLWAATSDGLTNNPGNPYPVKLLQSWFGGVPLSKEPPFDVPTVPNLLEAKGISWANWGDSAFNDFIQLRNAGATTARNSHRTAEFFQKAASGQLPAVNWIFNDDTGKQRGTEGMLWAGSVVDAIKNAPGNLWERSAILITWDDWGGFYDHVNPVDGEAPARFQQGGRVPLLILSPYAKRGTVFHEPTIHASVPAFIEKIFGLPHLNTVDAGANDLMRAFDFSQKPLAAPVTKVCDVDVKALEAMVTPMPKASFLKKVFTGTKQPIGLALD